HMSNEKLQLSLQTSSSFSSPAPFPLRHPDTAKDSPLVQAQDLLGKGKLKEALALLAPLRGESSGAQALAQKIEGQGRQMSSLFGVQLLQSFYSEGKTEVLGRLAAEVQGKKGLKEAYAGLSAKDQQSIAKQVGERRLGEILSLSQETDADSFWQGAVHFGLRLKQADQLGSAGSGVGGGGERGRAVAGGGR